MVLIIKWATASFRERERMARVEKTMGEKSSTENTEERTEDTREENGMNEWLG